LKDGVLYRSPYAAKRDFPDAFNIENVTMTLNRCVRRKQLDRITDVRIPNGPHGAPELTCVYGGRNKDGTEKIEHVAALRLAHRRLRSNWDGRPDYQDNEGDLVIWTRLRDFGVGVAQIQTLASRQTPCRELGGRALAAKRVAVYGTQSKKPWVYHIEDLLALATPERRNALRGLMERSQGQVPVPAPPTPAASSPSPQNDRVEREAKARAQAAEIVGTEATGAIRSGGQVEGGERSEDVAGEVL
jgi:hypothetical protein